MVEISCLIEQGYFTSYRELATQLGVQHNTITEIGKGRYYCNLKLIYQAAALYPELDILWVVLGEAGTGRPDPTQLPVRERGRPALN